MMNRKQGQTLFRGAMRTAVLTAVLTAGAAGVVRAQEPGPEDLPLATYKLRNGLTVILSEDNRLPVVTVAVAYNVGSIHEQPKKTGLASLVEYLMLFAGSANVPRYQHINHITRIGGSLNANALEDKTVFYQTIPSNRLALALWLEADRMRFLDINDTRFNEYRGDILDDFVQRKRSEPYLASQIAFDQMLFPDFAFSHPIQGLEEDIRGLDLEDVRNFYALYYAPNNAVLCITGDINRRRAQELVARYFETLPRGKDISVAFEPPANGRAVPPQSMPDPVAPFPAFHLGYRLAPPAAKDFRALVLLDYYLTRGRSSRLNRRLLGPDSKIAFRAYGGIEIRLDRAVFKIFVQASEALIEVCRRAVFGEMDKVKRSFLTPEEMDRIKAMFREDYLQRISNTADRALYLINAWFALRDFDAARQVLDRTMAVSRVDVLSAARRYFADEKAVLLNVRTR
jgi:predicted Zn-dependent peptidase